MPTISTFYGLKINMYLGDHAPPHFHVIMAEYEAKVAIKSGRVIAGRLAKTAQRLVKEWAHLHRAELAANWERAMKDNQLHRIEGLK
jgi:Domain of unknown function (DUF4160)